MNTVAIVQARLGSSRLPGKVLADLGGDTMLSRVIARLRAAKTIDTIVIATTTNASDDPVVREARRLGAGVFRGSETDVLERYVGAARAHHAGMVVRITSDCPLIDPGVVDDIVRALRSGNCDYASNTHTRTFPRGLDAEALLLDTLERIWRLATSPAAHEHVTAFINEQPDRFRIRHVFADRDDSDLRFTVDTAEDLAFVRQLYADCDLARVPLPYREVVDHVRARPELVAMNKHVVQRDWHHVA